MYAYRHALELKPNYVRAWVNMGISYANQNKHLTAAKYYAKALRYASIAAWHAFDTARLGKTSQQSTFGRTYASPALRLLARIYSLGLTRATSAC